MQVQQSVRVLFGCSFISLRYNSLMIERLNQRIVVRPSRTHNPEEDDDWRWHHRPPNRNRSLSYYCTPARTKDFGPAAEKVTPVGGEAQPHKVPSPNCS